ncbi:Similar to hypothetical protein [Tuber melanosporum Mel28]; acc. no. XP_002837738 [Pyronema omphalodes CBS 100304]|uniref:DUF4238 domain-containing protein n=1 Tax=Pyronema omphalodes (strain CBS 100304) TaxID=1076935 RepID=U4LKG0_PYROM|nr:Similar to hypothetical protein [Tuber melanosporum Mel28]; acc. no. XP_002837738 [Pyronema omphalodes CBS 100304]
MEAKSQYHHFIPRFVLRDFAADTVASDTVTATTEAKPNPKKRNRKKKKKKSQSQSQPTESGTTGDDVEKSETEDITEALETIEIGGVSHLLQEAYQCSKKGISEKQPQDHGVAQKDTIPVLEGQTPVKPNAKRKKKNKRKGHPENDPKNPPIKYYDLSTLAIESRRVARAYGIQDMYRDMNAEDVNHIENKLAMLEQSASQVVRLIKDFQKNRPSPTINLTRMQLYDVRKFLFIMKYRTPLFWKKYSGTLSEYNKVDKKEITAYMRKHNMTKPSEVWLRTLKVLLDTKVDAAGEWEKTVVRDAFKHDALWYIINMNFFYLAFCEPADEADEFVITDNGFGIHEGPTYTNVDKSTGIEGISSYTEYHKLAPLSPKLMLVLRSNYLRKGCEADLRKFRMRPEVGKSKSLFENLPIEAATPSYASDTALVEKFEAKDEHTFAFKIQSIPRQYVDLFNGLLLHEARGSITWRADSAMQRTLDIFLKGPKFPITGTNDFVEMKRDAKIHLMGLLKEGTTDIFRQIESGVNDNESEVMQGYLQLGGTSAHFVQDWATARLVTDERSKLSEQSPKGPENLEARNASNRLTMMRFSQLPARVIYFHVKLWRASAMINAYGKDYCSPDELMEISMTGPEDIIAKCFMENTPFYSTLGQQIMSSERSKDLESTMDVEFRLDLKRRLDLMTNQILEDIWAETEQEAELLHDLIWDHLWPTVESLAVTYVLTFGGAGDEAN